MLDPLKEDLLFLVQNYYVVIIVAAVSLSIRSLLSKAWRRVTSTSTATTEIPGRLGLPILGETLSFLSALKSTKGCYEFVKDRRKRYGKLFKTRIYGKIHVFVPSTEGARTVFSNEFVGFRKGYFKSMIDAVGANSLFCVSHESHKRIRHLLSDPFSMNSLSKYVKDFDSMMSERLKKLEESGKSFSVHDFGMKITFDSMCNLLMSITEESLLQQIEEDCTAIHNAIISFPVKIPGTRYYKCVKARKRLMETFRGIITRRRDGVEYHEDFLQAVLEKDSYPSDEKLSDSEILDNLLTLIVSGQTSTATTMSWSVKFLDENRETQDKLREEQLSIRKNKPSDRATLNLEDVNSMAYGLKVMKETLRMSNPVLWFPRRALNDCSVDGVKIEKGWNVNVDATYIHFDPMLYKDPEKFNPSRFDEIQKPYSFIPFGSGPRTCLGLNMAKLSLLIFYHRLTSGYVWAVDDPDPSLEENLHIPRLRSGCPITLKRLNSQ